MSYRRKDLISHQVEPGWQLHTMLFRRSYIRTFHRIHTIIRLPKRLWKDVPAVFFCRSVASFLPQLFSFEDGTLWLLYLREPKDNLTRKTSIFYRSRISAASRELNSDGRGFRTRDLTIRSSNLPGLGPLDHEGTYNTLN